MISNWRRTFREEYSWLLLPAFLVIAFTVDNRTGVTNFMRAFCFPLVLFALTAKDYKAIWANPAARAFWLFIGWLNITLLWDGLSEKDWWFFQRNFHLFTLMGMVYLVAAYKPEKQNFIFYTYLFGGFVCALLILWDWPGTPSMVAKSLKEAGIKEWWSRWHYYTRGVFPLSHYMGWMMGVLFIAAAYVAIKLSGLKAFIFSLSTALFLILVVFSQLRGVWMGIMPALVVLFAWHVRLKTGLRLLGLLILLLFGLAFLPGIETLVYESIARGDSFRMYIWQIGLERIFADIQAIVIGFGLSSSTVVEIHPHLHNLYLNTLHYGGVMALLLYLWMLWCVIVQVRPLRDNSLLLAILLCMQVAFLVDGEYLFVAPSAMMLAYILPLMWAIFGFKVLENSKQCSPKIASTSDLPKHACL